MTGRPLTAICRTLGVARRTTYYVPRPRPQGFYRRAEDATVLRQIRTVTNSRATYGYRRVWAVVNRTFRTGYNPKRIRRVMRMHGLMLPPPELSAAWAPPSGPGPAAGVQSALGLGHLPRALLEWGSPLGRGGRGLP